MGLIPWRAVRARVLAVAVVEHGKVWAGSLSRLKARAVPTMKSVRCRIVPTERSCAGESDFLSNA